MKERPIGSKSWNILVQVSIIVSLVISQLPVFAATVPGKVMIRGCDELSIRDIPPLGVSGTVRFDCDGRGAFLAAGTATPVFDLTGTGFDSLGIIPHSASVCSFPSRLEPKALFIFSGPRQEYDYCVSFSNGALRELGGFNIEWRTGQGGL